MRLPARLYRQFDADPRLAVPAASYGGWQDVEVELDPQRTALVVMHAWDTGQPGQYPGWDRTVEYRDRARSILDHVFPPLLAAVRSSPLAVLHVVGGGNYYRSLPGYRRAVALAGQQPDPRPVPSDPSWQRLQSLRRSEGFPGEHNAADIARGFAALDFAPQARPRDEEGVAENAAQLGALCRERGINHLVYVGFALNWCLLMAPGGMVDMARLGCLCSTIEEAVTAVENRETAATEAEKAQALWRVALEFGFSFRLAAFLAALPRGRSDLSSGGAA